MIDSIMVSPSVHIMVGTVVLLCSLTAVVVSGWAVWKKQPLTPIVPVVFILFQLALMVQVLVGIKLLDQGLGVLQLYIHYIGGLAPLAFCLLFYWLPATNADVKSRRVVVVATLSFFFVLMTFVVGSMYVPGGV